MKGKLRVENLTKTYALKPRQKMPFKNSISGKGESKKQLI
jgi:hypothetical protein